MSSDHNMHCSANQQKPICKNDLQVEICKPEWVGLTDDEMFKLWLGADEDNDRMSFGKAVEAKLKEKNYGTI